MKEHVSSESLLAELRHYIDLRTEHLKYSGIEKLSYILATLIFIAIGGVLGCIAACNFTHSLLHLLLIYVGATAAYAITGAIVLIVVAIIYWQRRRWILHPIARVMSRMLLDNDNEQNDN